MRWAVVVLVGLLACGVVRGEEPTALGPGDHQRRLVVDGRERACRVHIPESYVASTPMPLVLALHGAGMEGSMMVWFSGMNAKSDAAGFVVAYPTGTGIGPFCTWNAGGFVGPLAEDRPDDVKFIAELLDDLSRVINIDSRRVYACGMSNGGMMCYRLAAELSDRIAAIAPVAGTMAIEVSNPQRPVSVLHFHGTGDRVVPFERTPGQPRPFIKFQGVAESIATWVKLNQCAAKPEEETLVDDDRDFKVTRKTYRGGAEDTEVALVTIENGGHTWPGRKPPVGFVGRSTLAISANDLIWEFFQQHPMK